MDRGCRICSFSIQLHPMETQHRDILHWMFKLLNIDFQSRTLQICTSCKTKVMSYKTVYGRKREAKYRIALVLWDYTISKPIRNKFGAPMKYSISRNRKLDGSLRSPEAELAADERAYEIESSSSEDIDLSESIQIPAIEERVKRKTQKEIEDELNGKIISREEFGLKVIETSEMGFGIQTKEAYIKGDHVATYHGIKLEKEEANDICKSYREGLVDGSYLFFADFKRISYCVDATVPDGSYGRLINHSIEKSNLIPKKKKLMGLFIFTL